MLNSTGYTGLTQSYQVRSSLTPNTGYTFAARAKNMIGTSVSSSPTTQIYTYSDKATLALAPNSPTQITFTTTPPTGGASAYHIYYSNGTRLASSVTTSYSSSIFSANTAYSFYVTSINSASVENPLSLFKSNTASTTTYSGQATLAVAVNNTAQITFTITAPTGGSSSYSIYYSNGTLLASSVTLTSYSSSVFSANTAYSFYVSSFNSAGVQCLPVNNSTTVSTTTYSGQASLGLTPNSPSQITFTISAPAGGASGYNIYYSNGTLFASNATSYSPSVFSANTAYSFYVSSINNAGVQCLPANNSSTVSTTTYSGQASLSLSSSGPTQITFSIGAPAGGALAYNIYDSNGSLFASSVSTSYSSSVFSGSTTYSFYVSSINSAGVRCLPANNSATASITTAASFPGVTSGISTSGVSSSQITVNWNAVDTATYYNVYLNGGGPYTTSATSYGFTGLSPSTTYTFVVKAGNADGENPSGATTSATTTAPYIPVVQRWNNNQVGPIYPSPADGATKFQIYLRTNTYPSGRNYGCFVYSGPVVVFSSVSIRIDTPGNYTQNGIQTVTYSINGGGSVTINGYTNRTGGLASPADWGYTQITWSA